MECIETSQVLVRKEKTGKPSRFQAIDIIGHFELLRRGSWVRGPAGSPRAGRGLSQILPVLFLPHACSAMSAPGDFLPEKPVSSPVAKGIGMKDRQGSFPTALYPQ